MILSGRDIKWYVDTGKLKIEPVNDNQYQQNGVDLILDIVKDNPFNFSQGNFYLGGTKEILKMPDDLMAFVELRSTWARCGLILPPTIVDAGFEGNLTLEIGSFTTIKVPYGERFAHLIFAKMTSPSEPYNGKYKGQSGITPSIMDNPVCKNCGSLTIKTGSCFACPQCGESGGC